MPLSLFGYFVVVSSWSLHFVFSMHASNRSFLFAHHDHACRCELSGGTSFQLNETLDLLLHLETSQANSAV